MSQNDLSIANQGFASFRSDLNSALQALGSTNSGTSAPSITYANQLFYDTTNNILKIRNEDNDAFISLFTLDQTNDNIESLTINGAFACEGFTSNGIDDNADATAITIDSTERVGIGETSPQTKLHIKTADASATADSNSAVVIEGTDATRADLQFLGDASAFQVIYFGDNSDADIGRIAYDHTGNSMRFTVNASERMRIDSSGRVMIGTTTEGNTSADDLTIATTGHTGITLRSGTTQSGAVYFSDGTSGDDEYRGFIDYTHSSNSFRIGTNSVERMKIDSSGNVGIGTSPLSNRRLITGWDQTGAFGFEVDISPTSGNIFGQSIFFSGNAPDSSGSEFLRCRDVNTSRLTIFGDGDVDNHDNSYSGFSDLKLKEQIEDASSQWEDIKALTVRKFKFKTDVASGDSDKHWRLGVVAQEVESAGMNGLVTDKPDRNLDTNEDLGTTTKSVKYSILYMKAVKALQEAITRIETLEAEVKALKGE